MFRHLVLALFLLLPASAMAQTDTPSPNQTGTMIFKGKLLSGGTCENSGRGVITLDSHTVGIEHKALFSSWSCDFRFDDMTQVQISRNLFRAKINMTPKKADDTAVIIQTRPRNYKEARALLRSRL